MVKMASPSAVAVKLVKKIAKSNDVKLPDVGVEEIAKDIIGKVSDMVVATTKPIKKAAKKKVAKKKVAKKK